MKRFFLFFCTLVIPTIIIVAILCVHKKDNEVYAAVGTISGKIYEYKIIKDSQRAEVGGAPAVTEVTKVYPGVEVRANETIKELLSDEGGTYYRDHGDMGIKTYTDAEGKYTLKIPLKSSSQDDGRLIQVYLPKSPFNTWVGNIKCGTTEYVTSNPIIIQNSENCDMETPNSYEIPNQ